MSPDPRCIMCMATTESFTEETAVQIETTRFGNLEIDEREVISMVEPIIGFPHTNRFVLLEHKTKTGVTPFKWLQSVEDPALAFVLLPAQMVEPSYKITMTRDEASKLKIEDPSDAEVWTMLVIPPNEPKKMTANLKAPVVINPKAKLGKQVVLIESKYSTKHRVFKG